MWFTLHSELMGPSISAGALAAPVGSFLPAPCALFVCVRLLGMRWLCVWAMWTEKSRLSFLLV